MLILNQSDKLIWIANRFGMKNSWQMPQGGIDIFESEETALFREMFEEVGTNNAKILHKLDHVLTYEFKKEVYIEDKKTSGQAILWFFLEFNGSDEDFIIGKEFSKWKWAEREEVLNSIVDFKKPMYEEVLDELEFS